MPSTGAAAETNKRLTTTAAQGNPLYKARRMLHTGAELLTDKQIIRLRSLFPDERHVEVQATGSNYQWWINALP